MYAYLGRPLDKAKAVNITHHGALGRAQNIKATELLLEGAHHAAAHQFFAQRQADWASDLLCSAMARGKKKEKKM
jgi:hypothetical protein